MKIGKDIRLGDDLPHDLHIGMFLCDVVAGITVLRKASHQSGFTRATRPYHAKQRAFTGRIIHKLAIIAHQTVQLLRAAQYCQGISDMDGTFVGWMHFRPMIMPQEYNIEMVRIFQIADCLGSKR